MAIVYPEFSIESFNGILVAAWISGGRMVAGRRFGALKVQCHAGPQQYIGNSTNGWETVQVVEPWQRTVNGDPITCEVFECGLYAIPDGTMNLIYNINGFYAGATYRYSRTFGLSKWYNGGPPGGITGTGGGTGYQASFVGSRISAAGLGQAQGWTMQLVSDGVADTPAFYQNNGTGTNNWTATVYPVGIVGTALAPYCGGCWFGNQFGILYTLYAAPNKIYYHSSANPRSWPAGPGIDTGFTGRVCGMATHRSKRLVALVQDLATLDVKAIVSDDLGATWNDSDPLGITPTQPPLLKRVGDVLYCVYLDSDAPRFLASVDGGFEWL